MKLKIKSNGDWTNTYVYLDDKDVSDEIEYITTHVIVGELTTIHVKLRTNNEPIELFSPKFALEVFDAEEIPK